jgi:hypothetical protein
MKRFLALAIGVGAAALAFAPSAQATSTVSIDGSYKVIVVRPESGTRCPSGLGNECGVFQLTGLGAADYVYVYGPTFDPTGTRGCFYVDGTFTITLRSDGSSISGPSSGVFCAPGVSGPSQQGKPSYGNPQNEHDTILFSAGSGQFAGLHGAVDFSEADAGAYLVGSVRGVLSA